MSRVGVGAGVELNFRTAGTGPTLLFHPGFSNNLDLWNWLVAELSPTHRCVTFDPRGHGESDKPDSDYTLDELARDVEALCEGLDLTDVTLVGHSLGGVVSLTSVLDHNEGGRVTRLALLAPAVPTWIKRPGTELGAPPELFDQLAAGFGASFVPSQLGIADVFFHQTDAVTARWIMEQTLAMPVHIARRLFGSLQHIDFADRLKEVAVPSWCSGEPGIRSPTRVGWTGSPSRRCRAGRPRPWTADTGRWSTSPGDSPVCYETSSAHRARIERRRAAMCGQSQARTA